MSTVILFRRVPDHIHAADRRETCDRPARPRVRPSPGDDLPNLKTVNK